MAKKNESKANGYDAKSDLVRSAVQVVHINSATGERVGSFGEGVSSFGICLRQMMQPSAEDEGKIGEPRTAIASVYVASRDGTPGGWNGDKWMIGEGGAPRFGTVSKGSIVLGKQVGRLSPAIAATLYGLVSQFSAKAHAALTKASAKAA